MTASAELPHGLPTLLDAAGVQVRVAGRRADVVLARPQTRNAQTPATWRALAAVGRWAPDTVDVVVLSAQGPSFSSGLDRRAFTADGLPGEPGLHQLATLTDGDLDATIEAFQEAFTWWADPRLVTVAAVQGHAVGAGFQLALACDLRVLSDDARLTMAETSLGLVPDLGGTSPLVRAVGYPRALEICLTGRPVAAAEALALGLATQVVPLDDLAAAVDRLVEAVTRPPAGAVRATKELLLGAVTAEPAQQRAAERRAQAGRLRSMPAS